MNLFGQTGLFYFDMATGLVEEVVDLGRNGFHQAIHPHDTLYEL